MSFSVNSMNSVLNNTQNVHFRANGEQNSASIISKPIETISEKINEEKDKKHNRSALKIGGIVVGVTAAVALLNPRYSTKFAKKLQGKQTEIAKKITETKNSKVINKIYKIYSDVVTGFTNAVNFANNWNPFKDIWFKDFCTKEKEFLSVKDLRTRNKLKSANAKVLNITSKFHTGITKFFDSISKFTVKKGYKNSYKKLDSLESLLKQNLDKLSGAEKAEVEAKLAEISEIRKYFSEQNVVSRLEKQESYMTNLERDFMKKLRKYGADYRNKWIRKGDHFISNMYYWPEEILKPSRDKIEREGLDVVEKLIGDGKEKKGLYNDIVSIVSKHLGDEDKKALNKIASKADKSLRMANHNECIEYFDKKRDLILGSAPTDIVSASVALSIAGVAVASADKKEKRLSRIVTGVIPAIGGVGVSIGMAAALVSGGKAMLTGLAAAAVLNRFGILFDKYVLGNKEYDEEDKRVKEKHNKKEVKVHA